jgi:hypothetical protein
VAQNKQQHEKLEDRNRRERVSTPQMLTLNTETFHYNYIRTCSLGCNSEGIEKMLIAWSVTSISAHTFVVCALQKSLFLTPLAACVFEPGVFC